MQRVDPFIPVAQRHGLPPKRPLGLVQKRPVAHTSIDGIRLRPTAPPPTFDDKPLVKPPAPRQHAAAPAAPVQQQPVPAKRKRSWAQKLHMPLSAIGVVMLGFMLQSVVVGQIAIGIFAVYALLRRVESRLIFTLALMLIAAIIVLLLTGKGIQLVTNFAVYAFLLFVVGAVSLGREVLYE